MLCKYKKTFFFKILCREKKKIDFINLCGKEIDYLRKE